MNIEFANYTPEERLIVTAIVDRAVSKGFDRMDTDMDVSAVHAITPLRLKELSETDDFNFFHDIGGIARHLNRETGELMNCFRPRFTV